MTSAPALLGVDLGTTRLKVAAFTLDGRLLAVEAERNAEHRDGSRTWQDPAAWWEAAGRLSRRLVARPELAAHTIAGIGLSARAGGFVPVDSSGDPLAASWSDQRHRGELARLVAWRAGGAHLSNYAAGLVAKYLWLRAHEPERAARCDRLLYAKDWLVFRMTGRAVTDPTSGPDAADFDRAAIATLDVAPGLLPDVDAPWALAGTLTPAAALALGIA
ncbi:MAG: FGGY family carbohydrate kinase, partial [Chloroflexi bacterium]|nr:FGGY family carbohydrate kinase [Chloroflexota bacterium]